MQSVINILLATYNSEPYLTQQIDSLIEQSYQFFHIHIRDDGSTDKTRCIIQHYVEQYPQMITFHVDEEKRLGAKNSFIRLLDITNAKYYMFCDHDDIWLPTKIELTIQKMIDEEKKHPNKPLLIHTDLSVVDKDMNTISLSFWKYSKLKQKYLSKFKYLGVCNGVTGCTVMINQSAKEISLPMLPSAPMHDWWLALQAVNHGFISYIDQPTILYRQHHSNEVGASSVNKKYYWKKIASPFSTLKRQIRSYLFVKQVGYGSILKFFYYKTIYSIIRNI